MAFNPIRFVIWRIDAEGYSVVGYAKSYEEMAKKTQPGDFSFDCEAHERGFAFPYRVFTSAKLSWPCVTLATVLAHILSEHGFPHPWAARMPDGKYVVFHNGGPFASHDTEEQAMQSAISLVVRLKEAT